MKNLGKRAIFSRQEPVGVSFPIQIQDSKQVPFLCRRPPPNLSYSLYECEGVWPQNPAKSKFTWEKVSRSFMWLTVVQMSTGRQPGLTVRPGWARLARSRKLVGSILGSIWV